MFYLISVGIGLLLLILGAILAIKSILLKTGTEYVITNKRVVLKSGGFNRDATELMLNKCEGLGINQSLFGHIFNFGIIVITTGGATNMYKFVSQPMVFRNEINKQIS